MEIMLAIRPADFADIETIAGAEAHHVPRYGIP